MRQLAHIQDSSINVDYSILWIVATYFDGPYCRGGVFFANEDEMGEKGEMLYFRRVISG